MTGAAEDASTPPSPPAGGAVLTANKDRALALEASRTSPRGKGGRSLARGEWFTCALHCDWPGARRRPDAEGKGGGGEKEHLGSEMAPDGRCRCTFHRSPAPSLACLPRSSMCFPHL